MRIYHDLPYWSCSLDINKCGSLWKHPCWIGIELLAFAHMEYVLGRLTPKCFFIPKLTFRWALYKCRYESDSHNHSDQPSQALHTPFSPHPCPLWRHYDAQTPNALPHYPSYNTQPSQGMYANPRPCLVVNFSYYIWIDVSVRWGTIGCKHGKVDNSWSMPSVKWMWFNFMY